MKNVKTLFLFCALFVCISALAQKKAHLYGFAHDRITHENLIGTKVTLLKGDSVIGTTITDANNRMSTKGGMYYFADVVINGSEDYILLFEREGYNQLLWPLKTVLEKKPLKNGELRYLGDLPMEKKPKTHDLDGVTVKATQIKFYTKGDTVVYNADAFQTAEGSMLDALIKQLPGAELNDDGEIFVDGRKVESLMLNGEHFFKGNNKVMLENLPAYMVKTVKTYEKKGHASEIAGRDMGDKEFVMDIGLKREYSIGWIGNAEAGLGSHDRYLARLFALRFTPKSRITLYGNANNLNDTRKPGENSSWTPEAMPSGLLATKTAGIDVLLKSKDETTEYTANTELSRSDLDRRTQTSVETFLTDGNTFSRSLSTSRNRDFTLTSDHSIESWLKPGAMMLWFTPYIQYKKTNSLAQGVAMAFNQNPNIKTTTALIDSVYSGSDQALRQTIINRNINNLKQDGHELELQTTLGSYTKVGGNYILQVGQSISYKNRASDNWNQQRIDYPNSTTAVATASNRFAHTRPDNATESNTRISLQKPLSSTLTLSTSYYFNYNLQHKDYSTFQLEHLAGWDDPDRHPIGALPSEIEYATVLDPLNSYDMRLTTAQHVPILGLRYLKLNTRDADTTGINKKPYYSQLQLTFPLFVNHDRLDYTRANYDGITRRDNVFFSPSLELEMAIHPDHDFLYVEYNISHSAPSMVYALNLRTDEDPLNIYYGNPHLKNTISHNLNAGYRYRNKETQLAYSVTTRYNIAHNSVAMGYIYDKTTGIRTYFPSNVSGNYTLSLNYQYYRPLDKAKRLSLNNNFYTQLNHGVDLLSTDAESQLQRSSVMTYWTTDRLHLDYKLNQKVQIGAKGYIDWNRSTSKRDDFTPVTLYNFHYGLKSLVNLPLNMQFSTDLTIYSRRGYANASSNTDDLVWNARLTHTNTKACLTFALDAFDILGNLSNISQVLNSQGRTETFRNSLPRYVMAHVVYKFNRQPKKSAALAD